MILIYEQCTVNKVYAYKIDVRLLSVKLIILIKCKLFSIPFSDRVYHGNKINNIHFENNSSEFKILKCT